jgi:hypothetical protein
LKPEVFLREARDILADTRPAVLAAFVEALPLPVGELPRAKGERPELVASLPGLYSAASPALKRGFKIEAMERQAAMTVRAADETLLEAQRFLMEDLREAFPVWAHALTHPSASVRLLAVQRVPASGSALSPLLPLLASDSVVLVRQAARKQLGFGAKHSWGRATAGMLRAKDALLAIASAAPDTLASFALDHRTTVRYAVACRLDPGSPLFASLARDPSPRVRRCVAERVPLGTAEAQSLLRDKAQAVRSAIGARVLASEVPVKPPELRSSDDVSEALRATAQKQRRAAWAALAKEKHSA